MSDRDCLETDSDCRIAVLPEVVQNQIAAGEVVERPASVVKELIENALDAGARAIAVELEEGGLRLIRVSDDGGGMSERELALAVERHATSKIRSVEDIFRITSMGFRGEALPSIGAVSRLTIRSSLPGASSGHQLSVEGGRSERLAPSAPRPGTVIDVRDLFYNVPARRKFLKSPAAEVAAVTEILTRLALANPYVGFRLTNGGRDAFHAPPAKSVAERVAGVFGRTIADSLAAVAHAVEGLQVEGFVALPPESRANSRGIYVFLNGRWIRHPGILHVVRDAFAGMLPPRRFPFAVLRLELDPARVDVNVHPTKEEVRFENERMVVGTVRRAVAQTLTEQARPARLSSPAPQDPALSSGPTTPNMERTHLENAQAEPCAQDEAAADAPESDTTRRAAEAVARYVDSDRAHGSGFSWAATRRTGTGSSGTLPQRHLSAPARLKSPAGPAAERSADDNADSGAELPGQRQSSTIAATFAEEQQAMALPGARRHRVLAQAGQKYLVVEGPDGLLLVDQHAAHERWHYERLKGKDRPVTVQKLLLPVVVELPPAEAALAEDVLPILREAGFEIESFGDCSVSVSGVPDLVKPAAVERVVRDVFSDLDQAGRVLESLHEHTLASLACRSAVLFGQSLPAAALEELLDRFHEAKEPLTCPHGRPTTLLLSWDELARRFGRSG